MCHTVPRRRATRVHPPCVVWMQARRAPKREQREGCDARAVLTGRLLTPMRRPAHTPPCALCPCLPLPAISRPYKALENQAARPPLHDYLHLPLCGYHPPGRAARLRRRPAVAAAVATAVDAARPSPRPRGGVRRGVEADGRPSRRCGCCLVMQRARCQHGPSCAPQHDQRALRGEACRAAHGAVRCSSGITCSMRRG